MSARQRPREWTTRYLVRRCQSVLYIYDTRREQKVLRILNFKGRVVCSDDAGNPLNVVEVVADDVQRVLNEFVPPRRGRRYTSLGNKKFVITKLRDGSVVIVFEPTKTAIARIIYDGLSVRRQQVQYRRVYRLVNALNTFYEGPLDLNP